LTVEIMSITMLCLLQPNMSTSSYELVIRFVCRFAIDLSCLMLLIYVLVLTRAALASRSEGTNYIDSSH